VHASGTARDALLLFANEYALRTGQSKLLHGQPAGSSCGCDCDVLWYYTDGRHAGVSASQ